MVKKYFARLGAVLFTAALLISTTACQTVKLQTGSFEAEEEPRVLEVVTMYAGNDSNARNFRAAAAEWERKTGILLADNSVTSDETFKTRVLMDFRTGAEPDVLFFFNGTDASPLIAADKVVSLDEIRAEYPEYAANMKEELMQASVLDGRIYCIPVNGYWEALYVNQRVCEEAGVKIPDAETDWSEFLEICRVIKDKGYIPIAASLATVPHYWFEFCIYNHQTAESHARLPQHLYDRYGLAWSKGLKDMKKLYESGFFPDNTLSSSDDETVRLFLNGEAAFLLDGSWKIAALEESDKRDDFVVTYLPGMDNRRSTDIISGLSSGYYITRKAWNNPEKRAAAVSFVEYMTTDEMVSTFAGSSATALSHGVSIKDQELSPLVLSAIHMAEGATGLSEAVQDLLPAGVRASLFDSIPAIVRGEVSVEDTISSVIEAVREE